MPEATADFDPGAPWSLHLERAHALIHEVIRFIEEESEPSVHLTNAAEQIERGLGALYDAFDGRADRVSSVGRAHGRVWEAAIRLARAGLPEQFGRLRDACAEFVLAEGRFPRVRLVPGQTGEFRASIDRLPLHTLGRSSLVPRVRVPPLLVPDETSVRVDVPEPKTFEELATAREMVSRLATERARAQIDRVKKTSLLQPTISSRPNPPPGFAQVPAPAISDDEFLFRLARTCFDDIGMLAMQRVPLEGDDWRACQSLELRLVNAVDALAALGPLAVAHVEKLAMDAPAPDPMRVFGAATVGGCLAGRDALAMAERVLHRFGPGDPLVADAFVAAMKLATNPFVPNAMRMLLRSSDRACKAIAADVMAYRGWFVAEELDELVNDADARVFALVLPAMAKVRHAALERALERAVSHDNLEVRLAALHALAIAAHPRAAMVAREAADGALGDRALMELAIVGDEHDALWLFDRMKRTGTAASIEAMGWAGLVDAVPSLIALLELEDEDVRFAAGAALDRILGANLVETVEVEPEELDDVPLVDPNPEPVTGRLALVDIVSDPRDKPEEGSADVLEVPSTDVAAWRAYWAEHGARFQLGQRVRRGQAYSAQVVLYELRELALSANDRRRLSRELARRTGRWVHWDAHDFVSVQEACLEEWGRVVERFERSNAAVSTTGRS